MTEGESRAPGRGARGLKIALAVSVALNLAAAGFLVGLAIGGPPREGRRAEGLGHYARALPEPYRHDLLEDVREGRPDWGARRDALGHSHAELRAALVAEPFNAGRVSAALAEQRGAMCALAERGAGLLLAQIGRMSPEERRAYAAALERPRKRADR
jgi:hypothetical protein